MNPFKWYKKLEEKKRKELFLKGYRFAAAILLKQFKGSLIELESYIDTSITFDSYSAFEDGIDEAIEDAKKLNIITKEMLGD